MTSFFMGMRDQLLVVRKDEEGYHFSTPLKGIKPNQLAVHPENVNKLYLVQTKKNYHVARLFYVIDFMMIT